eukprot:a10168_44.p2 GENE.a10168_44~~a10168_44.p2  ORF type:complete len:172 (-),score=55.40 a10168_44:187-642(-)
MAAPRGDASLLSIEERSALEARLLVVEPTASEPARAPVKPETFRVPPSSVLERVRGFLPTMQRANQELVGRDPSEISIEVADESEPHIELELGLGVFDVKGAIPERVMTESGAPALSPEEPGAAAAGGGEDGASRIEVLSTRRMSASSSSS